MHSGVWHLLADGLAEHFTLHLVDLPGHGHSDWQAGAFELDRLLPELAENTPQRAVWLGWSLGGLIALAFTQRYPEKVNKLSLMAATPLFVQQPDWPCAMEASVFESFAINLDVDQQQTLQRFLMLQAKGAEQSRATIRELSQQLATQHTPDTAALVAGLDCLLHWDMRKALSELDCPVQLILGNRDTLIPASLSDYAVKLNPELMVSLVDGGGHAPFIAQPQQCQQLIEQFIHG
jgi:pimeloyl-[acyl-carrier protein] methyl ester esterase